MTDGVLRPVISAAAMAEALSDTPTAESQEAMLRQVGCALTRGVRGTGGPDADRELLDELIGYLGYADLLWMMRSVPGLPTFVGTALQIRVEFGHLSVSHEFAAVVDATQSRWPDIVQREFWRAAPGSTHVDEFIVRGWPKEIDFALGEGDLDRVYRQATGLMDLAGLVRAEVDYLEGVDEYADLTIGQLEDLAIAEIDARVPVVTAEERHARVILWVWEPEELAHRRAVLTENLPAAEQELAQWQAEYG